MNRKMNKTKIKTQHKNTTYKASLAPVASDYKLHNSKCHQNFLSHRHLKVSKPNSFSFLNLFLFPCSLSYEPSIHPNALTFLSPLFITLCLLRPNQLHLLNIFQISLLSIPSPHILGLNYGNSYQSSLPVSSFALPPANFPNDFSKVHKSDYHANQDTSPMDKAQISYLDLAHPSIHFKCPYSGPKSLKFNQWVSVSVLF